MVAWHLPCPHLNNLPETSTRIWITNIPSPTYRHTVPKTALFFVQHAGVSVKKSAESFAMNGLGVSERKTFVQPARLPLETRWAHYCITQKLQLALSANSHPKVNYTPAPALLTSIFFSDCSVIAHKLRWCISDNRWTQRALWKETEAESWFMYFCFIVLLSLGPQGFLVCCG